MRTKLYLMVSCLFILSTAKAQKWGDYGDDQAIQFTYTLQYLSSQYKVFKTADWQEDFLNNNNRLNSIRAQSSPGFGIGLGISKSITEHVDVRLIPTLVLNDRILDYSYQKPIGTNELGTPVYLQEKKVQAFLVELPLSIKLKSDRRKNFGAYLTGGAKYSMDLSSAKRNDDQDKIALEKTLKNTRQYLSYEAGLGVDLYFEYFKLSPEIKYSSTFTSILKQDNSAFSRPIDKLMLRHVTLSLFIQ